MDLFSGIGGFSLAAEWAGFRTAVFCEIDDYCQKVLKKNWPEVPIIPDIRDFQWHGSVTLLTGGPPCQRTSVAAAIQGKRTGETLWPQMAGVICDMRPAWIIVEQPAGNKGWENQVKISLESLGYRVTGFKRKASDCGAPHSRQRVFFIANASGERLHTFTRLGKSSPLEKIAWPPPPRGAWRSARTGNSGMDNGVSNWVDRIKALGNAVVPQCVFPILQAIAQIESGDRE